MAWGGGLEKKHATKAINEKDVKYVKSFQTRQVTIEYDNGILELSMLLSESISHSATIKKRACSFFLLLGRGSCFGIPWVVLENKERPLRWEWRRQDAGRRGQQAGFSVILVAEL